MYLDRNDFGQSAGTCGEGNWQRSIYMWNYMGAKTADKVNGGGIDLPTIRCETLIRRYTAVGLSRARVESARRLKHTQSMSAMGVRCLGHLLNRVIVHGSLFRISSGRVSDGAAVWCELFQERL